MTSIESQLERLLERERLPTSLQTEVVSLYRPLAARIARETVVGKQPYIVGLCGAQGSGKSTAVEVLRILLSAHALTAAVVSLDDLYLTRDEREALALRIHPLLRTRGVPGTHDIELGMRVFDALASPGTVALPRFDKSRDDRRPAHEWPTIQAPVDVILFEGWCVGARPQLVSALEPAINTLEHDQDPHVIWRHYVNDTLATHYAPLFARIDTLVLLQAPSFDVVFDWRSEQEAKLRARVAAASDPSIRVMTDGDLRTFVAHYERLTRHILSEMPTRADIVIELDADRRPTRVRGIDVGVGTSD